MKQTLLDYGVKLKEIPLLCDNEGAIKIANNPVQHSRTKHIDIRRHILRDHVSKGDIKIDGVSTNDQLADIFTKPLNESHFCKLRNELNVKMREAHSRRHASLACIGQTGGVQILISL
jgi:hypothetical protein